jgi:hypothetical protein
MNKISSMLDTVADSLEARGLIKEAYEIDKVADAVEVLSAAPMGLYFIVTYKDATGRTGVIGLHAANPAEASKKVNHMLSADMGGWVINVKPEKEPEVY